MKVCFQMYRPGTGERSDPFVADAEELVVRFKQILSEPDGVERGEDMVVVVYQIADDGMNRPVVSRFPILKLKHFVELFDPKMEVSDERD